MTVNKLAWIEDELTNLKSQGLFTNIRALGSPQGGRITIQGVAVWN